MNDPQSFNTLKEMILDMSDEWEQMFVALTQCEDVLSRPDQPHAAAKRFAALEDARAAIAKAKAGAEAGAKRGDFLAASDDA